LFYIYLSYIQILVEVPTSSIKATLYSHILDLQSSSQKSKNKILIGTDVTLLLLIQYQRPDAYEVVSPVYMFCYYLAQPCFVTIWLNHEEI